MNLLKIYTEHFKESLKKLAFPEHASELFAKTAQKLDKNQIYNSWFEKAVNKFMYPKAHDIKACLGTLSRLGVASFTHPFTMHAVFLIACGEIMHERYREAGLSDELFWDTLMDIRYKYDECVDCKGVDGVFVAFWYTGFYSLERFALGRFQFEYSDFGHDDMVLPSGVKLTRGERTIGFHIPSSGIPLTDEVRLDAYKKAYEFFKDCRRDDGLMIFECGSWLLYEGHREFLPPKSNILRFMDDFEIIHSEERDKFNDAWRVFGKYGYMKPQKWPEDTSLRKAFKQRVLSGKKTGHGNGVIVFDGEKIIK